MSVALANPTIFPLRPSQGSGPEYRFILNTLGKVQNHEERSVVLGWRQGLREQLADIIRESSEWGGIEGEGKSLGFCAIESAKYVIDLLPETDPLPDLVPTSNGGLAFEFDRGKNYLFSLVVTKEGKIIYAGIFGENNKQFGEKVFSDEIPKPISSILQSYFSKR